MTQLSSTLIVRSRKLKESQLTGVRPKYIFISVDVDFRFCFVLPSFTDTLKINLITCKTDNENIEKKFVRKRRRIRHRVAKFVRCVSKLNLQS